MNTLSPQITRAVLSQEKELIHHLWAKNLNTDVSSRFSWLYDGEQASAPFVFTAKLQESGVVGMIALMRRGFSFRERDIVGGQTIDFLVDKEYRNLFTALNLQKRAVQAAGEMNIGLIYGFPNKKSEPVQKHIGFKDIGVFQRWVKVLHTEQQISKMVKSSHAAKPLSAAADLALHIGSREFWHSHNRHIHASIEQGFEHGFDELWKSVKRHYPLIGERNTGFLSWRFDNCPHRKYRTFCIRDDEKNLLAYAIFHQQKDRIYVSDFLARDEHCLDQLLVQLNTLMRRSVASSVSVRFFGCSEVEEILSRNGFMKRPSEERLLVYAAPDQAFGSYVSKKQAWYMTEADHDT
ncbi:MAG: hypothetical protein ACLFSB_05670 [Chitinispirillaceae bacterium]